MGPSAFGALWGPYAAARRHHPNGHQDGGRPAESTGRKRLVADVILLDMETSTYPVRGVDYVQAFVACTDRGRHGRIKLGKLTQMFRDGGMSYFGQGLDSRPNAADGSDLPAHQWGVSTISMRCPKCHREAQLTSANASKLMDHLYAVELPSDGRMPTFDISRI